jgi:hypothetical protein
VGAGRRIPQDVKEARVRIFVRAGALGLEARSPVARCAGAVAQADARIASRLPPVRASRATDVMPRAAPTYPARSAGFAAVGVETAHESQQIIESIDLFNTSANILDRIECRKGRNRTAEAAMGFGYFTLSDKRCPDNPRTCERFMADIVDEALHAVYRHLLRE